MNLPRYTQTSTGSLVPDPDGPLVLIGDVQRGMGQMQSIIAYLVHWHCNDAIILSFEKMLDFAQGGKELKITITDDSRDVVLRVMDTEPPAPTTEAVAETQATTASTPLWVIDEARTRDGWLELRDPDGWWHAVVKFDGCIHLYHAGNVPFDKDYGEAGDKRDDCACDDYTHICGVDEYQKRLAALKAEASKFYKDWPL